MQLNSHQAAALITETLVDNDPRFVSATANNSHMRLTMVIDNHRVDVIALVQNVIVVPIKED